MGSGEKKGRVGSDPAVVREATRIMMGAPMALQKHEAARSRNPLEAPTQLVELSPTELLRKPTETLSAILGLLDKFLKELDHRVTEKSATNKDVKAFTDLVKAHAALRQTQLAEDAFTRSTQTLQTDTDVAMLLIEAVKAGGPQAAEALRHAMKELDAGDGE